MDKNSNEEYKRNYQTSFNIYATGDDKHIIVKAGIGDRSQCTFGGKHNNKTKAIALLEEIKATAEYHIKKLEGINTQPSTKKIDCDVLEVSPSTKVLPYRV